MVEWKARGIAFRLSLQIHAMIIAGRSKPSSYDVLLRGGGSLFLGARLRFFATAADIVQVLLGAVGAVLAIQKIVKKRGHVRLFAGAPSGLEFLYA